MKGFFLTWALTVGGAVASLAQPVLGMFVYVIFSIVRPQVLYGWFGTLSGVSQIVGIGMLLGWATQQFGSWNFGRAGAAVKLLIAYTICVSISAAFAPRQEIAWGLVIDHLKTALTFLVGLTMIQSQERVRQLGWILVCSQGWVGFEMNQAYLEGYNRAVFGLLGDNNSFAIGLVACIGPAIFLGIYAKKLWQKGVAFFAAALILHTVLLSFSRGAIMGLIVTGVVAILVMPKRPLSIAAVVLTVALGVRLTGPQVLARFMTSFAEEGDRDYSAESRLKLWQDCLTTMARNPLVGVGPRQWGFTAPQFGWPRGKSAHSYWLQIGAEQGIPAFTFLVLFYLFAMWRALQLTRSPDKWLSTVGCMSFTSLAGFAFSAQFVTVEGVEIPYFVALFCLSASRLQETAQPAAAPKPMPKPQPVSHQWAGPRSARPATREAR